MIKFQLGIEALLLDEGLLQRLRKARVAYLAHPASVTSQLKFGMEELLKNDVPLTCAFGPQHGMRGEKQDNMIESEDYEDPYTGIPVYSLYGRHRRLTEETKSKFDILLVDLQDVGCRIYTFLTTLFYMIEDLNGSDQEIWVLDRPNPAGREIEGTILNKDFYSFVGGAEIPMRHGLTLGEAGRWYLKKYNFDTQIKVIEMKSYNINEPPSFGWPGDELAWVNPSPNIPRLSCAKIYPGSVLVEGTWLSEGRGTTIPLEIVGHPDVDGRALVDHMQKIAPDWLEGCALRPCFFEPTFQKHSQRLCSGFQIHVDTDNYDESRFRPYRLISLLFRSVREVYPELDLWRPPPYEYEEIKLPIEILSGDSRLKEWADRAGDPAEWEQILLKDEKHWMKEREDFLLY